MKHDLIERYLYAVTRQMPKAKQEDVAQELRGLIDDMLTERCRACTPKEKDIRVVLTELGTPAELAAEYSEDGERCLIGQPYFSAYQIVMKVVAVAVSVGMAVSSLILMAIGQWGPWEMLGKFLANTVQGLASSFAFVTLLFAFFERRGVQWQTGLDDLPPVPKKTQEISLWESIAGIVLCVVFLVVFLGAPELLGIVADREGGYVPLFDVEAIRSGWYYILAFGILGIVGESVKLLERRYNKKVLTVTVLTNLLSGGIAVIWLTGEKQFHDAYYCQIQNLFAGNDFLIGLFNNFHLFFLGILLLALAMDTAETAYRTLKQ